MSFALLSCTCFSISFGSKLSKHAICVSSSKSATSPSAFILARYIPKRSSSLSIEPMRSSDRALPRLWMLFHNWSLHPVAIGSQRRLSLRHASRPCPFPALLTISKLSALTCSFRQTYTASFISSSSSSSSLK